MCDEFINQGMIPDTKVTRRSFGVGVGVAAAGAAGLAYAQNVVEKQVEVKTADGTADARLYYPAGNGSWPAVLVWTDIMGQRPAFYDMGKRLAAQGYVVLIPNPFYRSKKGEVVGPSFDFAKPEDRNMVMGYRAAMSDAGVDNDAKAYLAFLDAQPQTNKAKKAGVQGYCMGGALSFRTAAAVANRIGAVGSFHGGNGLVTAMPNSPHLLIPKTNATWLVCQAQNDDKAMPKVKDDLKAAFDAAKKTATVEVYHADHGWCVPGGAVYNQAEAERAWTNLSNLYKSKLA
jgi:carboxymethylenebutenolidase